LFADERQPAMPRSFELPVEPAPPVAPADSLVAEAAEPDGAAPRGWDAVDFSLMQQRYPLLRPSL
jgi:hypothetical protein